MTVIDRTTTSAGDGKTPRARPPRRGMWVGFVIALVLAVLAALGLARIGSKAIYIVAGVLVAVLGLWSIRDLISPPIADAVRRLRPEPTGVAPLSKMRTSLGAVLAVLAAGVLAFALAGAGTKATYAMVALLGLAGAFVLLRPAILLLFDFPPDGHLGQDRIRGRMGTGDRKRSKESQWAAIGLGRASDRQAGAGRAARLVGSVLIVLAAIMLAFLAATMGKKGLLVLAGSVIVVGCLLRARNKTMFLMFGTVCSLAFLEHKSFGGVNTTIVAGAPSLYISSFDAMVVLLYAFWIYEGSFVADARAAFHRRIFWVPLIGLLLMLPSLLAGGSSLSLGVDELVRYLWMFLTFFYFAVRVQTRAMVWAIIGGFACFVFVEIVVVLLQWKTGGVLGLSFLGVPTQLSVRVTDASDLGRPFGTILHPDVMAAAVGSLGILGLALGLAMRRSLIQVIAFVLAAGTVLCMYLAHTRSALFGLVFVVPAMIWFAVIRRQLQWRTIGKLALVLLIVCGALFPQLEKEYSNNFGTNHFSEEVVSRDQLNNVAGQMFEAHPLIGVGLNSFQLAMGPFEDHGVIFVDHPVQNLYLFYLSETGIIGFAGFLLIGIAFYNIALRLARSRDRLFGAVGLGVSAAMAFWMVEEWFGFSLREDVPLAIYWIFAGLAVACYRMAGLEGRRRSRRLGSASGRGGGDLAMRLGDSREYRVSMPASASPRSRTETGNGPRNDTDPDRTGTDHSAMSSVERVAPWRRRRVERRVDQLLVRAGLAAGQNDEAGDPPVSEAENSASPPRERDGAYQWSPRRRKRFGVTVLATVLLLGTLVAVGIHGLPGSASDPAPLSTGTPATGPVPISQMRIVFAARSNTPSNAPSFNGIFVVNGDGSGLKPLIEAPTNTATVYDWPQWALGGTKIVFTVRNGPPISSTDALGSYENIWEMNPDGSDMRQLTFYKFRVVQPKVSADGTSLIFTGQNPQFPSDAIYKLNLLTLQATNLSQVTQPDGAVDADPKWMPNGNIVLASSEPGVAGEQIDEINSDGTDRQLVLNDGNFNTDPEVSPDSSEVAYSAFDGPNPVAPAVLIDPTNPDDTDLNPAGWHIETRNLATGVTTVLTQGQACLSATVSCAPGQSSGWKPVYSPDGSTIAWTGRLNVNTTCICAANADGSDPRVLVQSNSLVIQWFDWTAPGGQAPSTAIPDSQIGSQEPTSRLLISGDNLATGTTQILNEPPDMMGADDAGSAGTSGPIDGSWSDDRSEFVFVANASYNINDPTYGPPPPPGQSVHEHFTLQELNPAFQTFPSDNIPPGEQVFLHEANGTIEQLTTPFTEDWRDALDAGDARSNTDPVLSPNGQYVVFTNTSSLTGESFLLSLNLLTGAVLNLTNGTAGAMQVDDAQPAWSPDSSKIAFTTTEGGNTDVYVMNASDGTEVTAVTDDNAYDMAPTWSPDGKAIVYSRYNGLLDPSPAEVDSLVNLPRTGWSLVQVDVATGQQAVLTTPAESPEWRPAYSPDGSSIAFIGWQYQTPGVFEMSAAGGPVAPVLITPDISETSVDWK